MSTFDIPLVCSRPSEFVSLKSPRNCNDDLGVGRHLVPVLVDRSCDGHPGGSINQHYLGSYQEVMLAVCLAQFSAKRYREGMEGVTALAYAARPLAALFQQELSLSSDDMAELARSALPLTEQLECFAALLRSCLNLGKATLALQSQICDLKTVSALSFICGSPCPCRV